ncbi:hypothetical protein CPBF367_00980 [Xanthomonas arboricola pv. juglandis]|nr:hypothetical protein CPBF367_00980 [Xanthomonas arboricola pv. juglandis]
MWRARLAACGAASSRCPRCDRCHACLSRWRSWHARACAIARSRCFTWPTAAENETMVCGVAAGPLPAHHRRTRRKYVHVGSYAASMPRKVPRRWAGKDLSGWSVCVCKQCMTSAGWITGRSLNLSPFSIASRATDRTPTPNLQTSRLRTASRVTRFRKNSRSTVWCGVLADCGTVWRHGCRHRASTDGFTACPASGEGTAPSTRRPFDLGI